MNVTLYTIRHRENGRYFLRRLMARTHSGTCTVPEEWNGNAIEPPRLFPSEKSAKKFLIEWQKGIAYQDAGYVVIDKSKSPRDRHEMEIIPVELTIL